MNSRPEVAASPYPVLVQHRHYLVTQLWILLLKLNDDILKVGLVPSEGLKQSQAGVIFSHSLIGMVVVPVGLDEGADRIEIDQAHGRTNLGHLSVRSRINDSIQPPKAEVAHQPHLLGQVRIVRRNGTPLKGIEELRGMETEDLRPAEGAYSLALVSRPERVGRIEQQL